MKLNFHQSCKWCRILFLLSIFIAITTDAESKPSTRDNFQTTQLWGNHGPDIHTFDSDPDTYNTNTDDHHAKHKVIIFNENNSFSEQFNWISKPQIY